MSALAEALVAAQRRAVSVLEKAYVAGQIGPEELATTPSDIGAGDTVDVQHLLATLEVIRIHGAQAPAESRPTTNGAPDARASDAQLARIRDARPYPKAQQLARGERRYRRRVASAKQWQRIAAEKHGPCRICCTPARNGGHSPGALIELHHIVKRGAPYFGDDVADNIVPLCRPCHEHVTRRVARVVRALAERLTDAEYAYCVSKLGEGAMYRLFGVTGG